MNLEKSWNQVPEDLATGMSNCQYKRNTFMAFDFDFHWAKWSNCTSTILCTV